MKTMKGMPWLLTVAVASFALAPTARAEEKPMIQIETRLAEVPKDTKIPLDFAEASKKKDVELLSAPSITTKSGMTADVKVVQEFLFPFPDKDNFETVEVGTSFAITPSLSDEKIGYKAKVTVRQFEGFVKSAGKGAIALVPPPQFVTYELYLFGDCKSGDEIWLDLPSVKSDEKNVTKKVETKTVLWIRLTLVNAAGEQVKK